MMAGLAMMASVLASLTMTGQTKDNPLRDQVPQYLRETIRVNHDAPLSTVITVNNYDNFNLGVDFGESNMAESPLAPPSYFTAYNTNTVHHTENGLTWADGAPSFGTTMAGDPVVTYDSLGNRSHQNS